VPTHRGFHAGPGLNEIKHGTIAPPLRPREASAGKGNQRASHKASHKASHRAETEPRVRIP